ncbi:MAG: 2-amino-4-hydroxy-6-hydroxymethyldihydropteridine diphosphokinase [Chloroflexi bacterium]|nr:MAG: 2-amino-4-hydroxy-6-hydroxymethyldihydropteridine diphosphokinase [Chloroflexota bacterium]
MSSNQKAFMENTAYLSLGSNIEPEINMAKAISLLARLTRLVAVSSVWETPAIGRPEQANYLNAAAIVQTPLDAGNLKRQILAAIERNLGRVRTKDKFAARPMDIDIIFFNTDVLDVGRRHIPDREVLERAFVAVPLAEIAPDYRHPETGQLLAEIAEQFDISQDNMSIRPDVSRQLARLVSSIS